MTRADDHRPGRRTRLLVLSGLLVAVGAGAWVLRDAWFPELWSAAWSLRAPSREALGADDWLGRAAADRAAALRSLDRVTGTDDQRALLEATRDWPAPDRLALVFHLASLGSGDACAELEATLARGAPAGWPPLLEDVDVEALWLERVPATEADLCFKRAAARLSLALSGSPPGACPAANAARPELVAGLAQAALGRLTADCAAAARQALEAPGRQPLWVRLAAHLAPDAVADRLLRAEDEGLRAQAHVALVTAALPGAERRRLGSRLAGARTGAAEPALVARTAAALLGAP